jgi:hypothetical protein
MSRPGLARQRAERPVDTRRLTVARRWLRHPLLWSPLIALIAQLVFVTAVAACSGGGDFPRIR